MWSTVLNCEFWIMETDVQAQAQRDAGYVASSVREVWVLQGLKAAHPDTFDAPPAPASGRPPHPCCALLDPEPTAQPYGNEPSAHRERSKRREASKPRIRSLAPSCPRAPSVASYAIGTNHTEDVWECWGCVPPALKMSAPTVAALGGAVPAERT